MTGLSLHVSSYFALAVSLMLLSVLVRAPAISSSYPSLRPSLIFIFLQLSISIFYCELHLQNMDSANYIPLGVRGNAPSDAPPERQGKMIGGVFIEGKVVGDKIIGETQGKLSKRMNLHRI